MFNIIGSLYLYENPSYILSYTIFPIIEWVKCNKLHFIHLIAGLAKNVNLKM